MSSQNDRHTEQLENAIVKNALLGFLPSIITIFLSLTMMICGSIDQYPPLQAIYFFTLFNICMSATCLLWSFMFFHNTYSKFCCCLNKIVKTLYDNQQFCCLNTQHSVDKNEAAPTSRIVVELQPNVSAVPAVRTE